MVFPFLADSFKLSAYADNVIVLVNTQRDIDVLVNTVNRFGGVSSAKVNWAKSEDVLVGDRLRDQLRLPEGLVWRKGGLKYLGVSLGVTPFYKKTGTGF